MHIRGLKNIVPALAIFTLVMSALPGVGLRGARAENLPRSGAGHTPSSFTQLQLYPNIETVGVTASGSGAQSADLFVRESGEANWHPDHPLMRIDDGRLAGSLFGLAPSTTYEVKVVSGSDEISGSVTTQPDELPFAPSQTIYVSANAPAGGNGSAGAPFQTIQAGVNQAGPGTQVLVADGVYHEAVTFPASGTYGNWIQVKAQGSGAILDGSQNRTGNIWSATTVNHVYFTKISPAIAYLGRDGKRFYGYDNITGLRQALGHNGVTITEGWYYEASTLKLYVRTTDDPASHSWQIPTLNHAFDVAARDWIWIEGFEMRFYGTTTNGCGVCTVNASHVVIRKNRIHNLQLGVYVNWNGSDGQGNDSRIEYNDISDPPVNEWPWNAVKGSSMEGTALIVRGRTGAIVRGNELHHAFNGIYAGSSAALENPALGFDADIYGNHIHHIGDDALEAEGACINQRFRNNTVDRVYVGFSAGPVTWGPVWVMRSLFTYYSGRGIKWDQGSDGKVLIYHNTLWSNIADRNAMEMISAVHNAVLRNNIFQSSGYGVYEVATGSAGHDWDHDNWYVTRPSPHFKWENISYNTLADFCAGTGLECNGDERAPGLSNPGSGDLTLLPTSPNIDDGVIIPGINDDFAGNGPDIGALEAGNGPRISGNAGTGGATLSYEDGGPKSITADSSGNYSITVPMGWSGTVTPSKLGFMFSPASRTYNNVEQDITGEDYTATAVTALKLQLRSQGTYDGWILESSETSGKGGTKDGRMAGFLLGDDAADRQYRAILSFNTAGLPDNAVIISAVLQIKQKAAPTGTNPFTILGNLLADVRAPYFGTLPGLQLTDFNAAASSTRVAIFNKTPVNGWYSAGLNATGRSRISKTGLTQFRLYFGLDDNDNRATDSMRFFSGNALVADRPLLVIRYTVP